MVESRRYLERNLDTFPVFRRNLENLWYPEAVMRASTLAGSSSGLYLSIMSCTNQISLDTV